MLAAFLVTRPASAQMSDPRYPVCMRTYGVQVGDRMDCVFMSLDQCQASALGLPATCLLNPYFAPRSVRPHRVER
ncbi:DUF3551 domain-containing protein [Bradyrhizobium jicamae]|uniref:DUF3551 domain-containing protein n=1 Tax=Bradyrhizobium jicamae TaxID=280332 RepID=UPI00390CA632